MTFWEIGDDPNRCPWDCGCADPIVFGHSHPCPLAPALSGWPVMLHCCSTMNPHPELVAS